MKNLTLDFPVRLKLNGLLNDSTGPLGKMLELQKVHEKIRFNAAEQAQMTVKDLGGGRAQYTCPDTPDWGRVKVRLEDSQAAALLREIDECSKWQTADVPLLLNVKAQLQ